MYILYRHIFPNDKVYIGITKQKPEKRWGCNGRGYTGCPVMYNAINKYGWEEEYRSLSEAARKNNISKSCICINLKKNKPILGKIWRYIDE